MPTSHATSTAADIKAVQVGAFAGLMACVSYPLIAFVPLPKLATTTLAALFGPALAVASFGLRRLLDWETPLASSALGALLNAVAGGLFSAMVLVQMAAAYSIRGARVSPEVRAVWLGLDVAWDAYIGVGTICFGVAMLRHPRFGRVFGGSAILIVVSLLALNLATFPTPPGNAGLVDVGPAIGLWYLAAIIRMLGSVSWARRHAAGTANRGAFDATSSGAIPEGPVA